MKPQAKPTDDKSNGSKGADGHNGYHVRAAGEAMLTEMYANVRAVYAATAENAQSVAGLRKAVRESVEPVTVSDPVPAGS